MIDQEANVRGRVHAHRRRQQKDRQPGGFFADIAERQERTSGHPVPDRVEDLAAGAHRQAASIHQQIGDLTERHAQQPHHHVRHRRPQRIRLDVKLQHVLHVRRNLRQQRPEAPVLRRMRYQQSPERRRPQYLTPRRLLLPVARRAAQRRLDEPLLDRIDALGARRRIASQPHPNDRPQGGQAAGYVENARPAGRRGGDHTADGQHANGAQLGARVRERAEEAPLAGVHPARQQRMHAGIDEALRKALNDARRAQRLPAPFGGDGRQQRQQGAHAQRAGEQNLGAVALRQQAGRHLRHNVAPEEAAQHQAAHRFVPIVLLWIESRPDL